MHRRDFLGLLAASALHAGIPKTRLTVIADEVGPSPEDWIAFAQRFGLTHLELRYGQVDGKPVLMDSMLPEQLKPTARKLKDAGLKVSFFNSTLLKHALPGTTPTVTEDFYVKLYARLGLTDEKMYADRAERLRRAIAAAQVFDCHSLRTFTFWRVAEPRSLFPQLVDLLGGMADVARKEGCELLVETEYATNVATSAEMRDLMAKLPASNLGVNWDPQNSLVLEQDVFPAGYEQLPRKRIRNVQLKYDGLFGDKQGKNKLDWGAIMSRMEADGYRGLFGLETHFGGPRNYEMSSKCMLEMQRIAASVQGGKS